MTLYYLSDTVFFARQFPPACLCEGSRTPAARCEQAKSRLYIIKKNHRQGNVLFAKQKLTEKLVRRGRFGDGSLSPKPSPLRTALSPNLAKKACTGQALSRPALYRLVNTGFYFFN
jgi:hypothetical protein